MLKINLRSFIKGWGVKKSNLMADQDSGIKNLGLNPEQLKAATAPGYPLLIVAGAGTGKTKTLMARIVYLMKNGVPPSKICALTFTNKAAEEMLARVTKSLSQSANRQAPFIGTFHSLGARILREVAIFCDRKPNFAIFDDNDSFQLFKKIAKRSEDKIKMKPGDLMSEVSMIKNEISLQDKKSNFQNEIIEKALSEYEIELKKNNAFDFDDLIQKVVLVFKQKPEVLKRYQKRFSHFLVDEYQDINGAQNEMVKLLSTQNQNLSVVGDHNQTIYSWRGSKIDIFLNFAQDWSRSQTVFLGENYRSTQNIIQAASSLIKNNFQKPKGLEDKTLWTNNSKGEKIILKETGGEIDEAEWIVEQVIGDRLKVKDKNESTAVLYRTNAQSRPIEQALIESNLPYQIFGGLKFYERREVKDVLAALRYISNRDDELSRERLSKFLKKAGFSRFVREIGDFKEAEPAAIIKKFIDKMDYFGYLDKNFENPEDRKENILELLNFAENFKSVEDFLERASLLQATDNVTNSKSPFGITRDRQIAKSKATVNLMTIHLAKGLEFDNVFVAGINEGVLPHHRSFQTQNAIEEERRLLYVAMTRARKKLFLSFYDIPSRFLSELSEEAMKFEVASNLRDEERYITLD